MQCEWLTEIEQRDPTATPEFTSEETTCTTWNDIETAIP